jgi:hypothetical protein
MISSTKAQQLQNDGETAVHVTVNSDDPESIVQALGLLSEQLNAQDDAFGEVGTAIRTLGEAVQSLDERLAKVEKHLGWGAANLGVLDVLQLFGR